MEYLIIAGSEVGVTFPWFTYQPIEVNTVDNMVNVCVIA